MRVASRLFQQAPARVRPVILVSLLLWMTSLVMPATWYVHEYDQDMPFDILPVSSEPGWFYLLMAWAGPLYLVFEGPPVPGTGIIPPSSGLMFPATALGAAVASFSWYANLLWIWTIRRLALGACSHGAVLWGSLILALAALQPIYFHGGFDPHGVDSASMPAIGAYVWAAAICLPAIASMVLRDQLKSRQVR